MTALVYSGPTPTHPYRSILSYIVFRTRVSHGSVARRGRRDTKSEEIDRRPRFRQVILQHLVWRGLVGRPGRVRQQKGDDTGHPKPRSVRRRRGTGPTAQVARPKWVEVITDTDWLTAETLTDYGGGPFQRQKCVGIGDKDSESKADDPPR